MTKVNEYVREECIPQNISPTGVKYAVFRDGDVDLYEILPVLEDEFGHEKADRRRSKPIDSQYTGSARAQAALTNWLKIAWDASDAEKLKRMKPAERAALNKEQSDAQ